ncbi:hypothetical protein BX600DRAFT_517358 [Xylariales sp. PMI_506]|nr:hypothetical protein BX600DRAFT_517358 [Xylariales sp. PMI_506]
MVLRKKEVYTVITPLPSYIPRQLAIDILHSHGEVITLNPLVISHKPIKAPRDAPSDEYYSTWYEITERIQYLPGLGKLGSGIFAFNGCFHDMPWGLQSHIYAPANVDLRNKYRIGGNQQGVEPPEQQEMGLAALGAPKDGLYLREDIEIRCNFAVVSMVKAQMKTASREMVDRIIKKAELLDSGALTAMIENGKLKTSNPNDRTTPGGAAISPPHSPTAMYHGQQPPMSPGIPYQVPRPSSYQIPPTMLQQQQQYNRPGSATGYGYHKAHDPAHYAELYSEPVQNQNAVIMELPGDYYHPQSSPSLQPPQRSPTFHDRNSDNSARSSPRTNEARWSQSQPSPSLQQQYSRPTSYNSDANSAPYTSPGLDHKGFASELAPHRETREEHRLATAKRLDPGAYGKPSGFAPYNPADYAATNR